MRSSTYVRLLATLTLSIATAACGGERGAAEEAARQSLKDPESARFGDFYYNEKLQRGCLTVNAKNSMGGYTGDQQMLLDRENGEWTGSVSSEMSQADCRRAWADNEESFKQMQESTRGL